jgi:hypothetical protein
VQSSPEVLVQTASRMPEHPREPDAVAWPDIPPSITAETSPDAAPNAVTANVAPNQTVSGSQNQEIVFLQRSGVNIRSTPSTNGPILGTAPKGTRLKVINREGEWVQVESGRSSGWINSQFLAPDEPQQEIAPSSSGASLTIAPCVGPLNPIVRAVGGTPRCTGDIRCELIILNGRYFVQDRNGGEAPKVTQASSRHPTRYLMMTCNRSLGLN